jgi:GcrA cell cycle regulator
MSWTDDRVELLSRLWLEGKSASMIATALGGGLTRNAVIGKVHRLGLAGRVKANGAQAVTPDGEEEQGDVGVDILVEVAGQRRAIPRTGVAGAESPTSAISSARIVQGNTALALAEAPAEVANKLARAPEDVVVPMSLRVTIVDLRETMCKWPLGDPSSSEFRYCGSPVTSGTPYCGHHGKIAYQPAQDRRRERERELRRPLLAR